MLRVRCKNVVERVLSFFDRRCEGCDVTLRECSFDIKRDLLLIFQVVNRALRQVESVIKVSLVETLVTLLHILAANAHNE